MKIGYFSDRFSSRDLKTGNTVNNDSGGGVGEVVYNLAIQMAKKGHEIFIFTTGDEYSYVNHGNILLIKYKSHFKIHMASISPELVYKPLFTGVKLDIAHVHMGVIPGAIAGYLFSKYNKIPLIISHHGDIVPTYGSIPHRISLYMSVYLSKYLLSKCNKIIAASESYVNASKYLKLYQNKISIIPNGVNLNEINLNSTKIENRRNLILPEDKKIILFVGNLTPLKGTHVLLKALHILAKEYSCIHLVVVGEGKDKGDLIRLSKELDLYEKITFTGYVTERSKIQYFNAADIFVLPSYTEAYPITLLEASAAELPLVVSGLECFKAIVNDGFNGLITITGDEQDLAKKLLYLLKNEPKCKEMGRNAKNQISLLSWEKIASQTEHLYLDILS